MLRARIPCTDGMVHWLHLAMSATAYLMLLAVHDAGSLWGPKLST